MRISILLTGLISILLIGAGWQQLDKPMELTLTSDSRLWVEGTSTIHDWSCEAEDLSGLLTVDASDASQLITGVPKTNVSIPVEQLECGKGKMNRKLRDALEADDHPSVSYTLQSAEVQATNDGWTDLKTTGVLTIAGTERIVEMTVQAKPLADGQFQFKGNLPLTMSDYGIDPPTALFGTLKAGDEVVVHFDIVAGGGAS